MTFARPSPRLRHQAVAAVLGLTVFAGPTLEGGQRSSTAGPGAWSIQKLFTRPYIWGTLPANVTWSVNGRVVVFTWNDGGQGFRDLYAVEAATGALTRLTDMAPVREPFSETDAERDPRLREFLMPPTGVTDFDVAPDGSAVTFVHRGDLFVVSTRGGQATQLTRTRAVEANPRYAPDGVKLAFTRDQDLYLRTRDGVERQLTTGGGPERQNGTSTGGALYAKSFLWSPDGARLAYLSIDQRDVTTSLLPNYSGARVTARTLRRPVPGSAVPKTTVMVVDAAGPALPVPIGEEGSAWSVMNWAWSPDATRLAIVRLSRSRKEREVLVASVADRRVSTIFSDRDTRWISPLTATIDWSADSSQILTSTERDFNHLVVVPAAGGVPRTLTDGPFEVNYWRSGRLPQWLASSGEIYFHSTEGTPRERHAYVVSPAGGARRRLLAWDGLDETHPSPDGRFLAVIHANLDEPGDLYLVDTKGGGSPLRITRTPLAAFATYPWIRPRFVEFASRADGKRIAARLLLPPGAPEPVAAAATPPTARRARPSATKRYPAIVFVHGAGYAQSVLNQWGAYNQPLQVFNDYLAHQGYVVLDLDYRGSSGYGRDWRSDVYLHLGGLDLQDELSGLDYLKTLGFVDTERVGIWGLSYGGFMTNMALLAAPTAFRAGVSWAPVNDWANYSWSYSEERLTTPRENPDAYRRSNPINFAAQLERPLLMLHGMGDDNVYFQDTVQLVESLVAAGKPFEVMFYPQENHVFAREDSLIDAFTRTAAFFDRHLR